MNHTVQSNISLQVCKHLLEYFSSLRAYMDEHAEVAKKYNKNVISTNLLVTPMLGKSYNLNNGDRVEIYGHDVTVMHEPDIVLQDIGSIVVSRLA